MNILMKHWASIHVTDLLLAITINVKFSIQNTTVLRPVELTHLRRYGQIVLTGLFHHLG